MFFHHRRLLNDSQDFEDSIFRLCEPFCDPLGYSDGYCPIPCIPRCYPICNNPIIYDSPPPPSDDHRSRSVKLSIFFTVSLAVLAIIFLILALYTAYRFYKVRNRARRTTQPAAPQHQDLVPIVREFSVDLGVGPVIDHPIWYIRTIGLPASVISSITTCKYKKDDGLVEGTECSVCLNEFQENESLRLLPKCQHAFHVSCIDTWLRSHTNCPLCRAPIAIATSQSQTLARQQNLGSSDQVLETQIAENRETEFEIRRLRIRVDDGGGENGSRGREDDVGSSACGVQQLRRSVSVDSLAASASSPAIANAVSMRGNMNLDNTGNPSSNPKGVDDDSDHNRISSNSVCSSSTETSSLPKRPSALVKRSLSCSAKVFLSRYSKGRSSTPPPPQ